MLFGAIAVLATGQISPMNVSLSINLDVILFLFGMFAVGEALAESGYLYHLSYRLFRRANSADELLAREKTSVRSYPLTTIQ
jgi:Na+/H+ antiporter NhaD/arsenite permease-like protein